MTILSVVIPIKDERDNLRPLHEQLCRALDPLCDPAQGSQTLDDYELLFVDDGSTDGSYGVLEELAARDRRVKVVRLRRNFGQTPALQAGIDHARGDVLATMDGDLQNDPADIPKLVAKLAEGYDAVFGLRAKRQDDFLLRKLPSWMGNWLIRKVTGVTIKDMGCTLRVMRRDLAESLPLYGELHRFVPVLATMQGARLVQVPVNHHPRIHGKTKYNITRTVRVVLDLITGKFLHSYVTRPMHVFGLAGLVSMGLGFVSLLATLWMKYFSHERVFLTGNPLLLLSAMLELVGVQFISMGLIGELLTRTYFAFRCLSKKPSTSGRRSRCLGCRWKLCGAPSTRTNRCSTPAFFRAAAKRSAWATVAGESAVPHRTSIGGVSLRRWRIGEAARYVSGACSRGLPIIVNSGRSVKS
jgi:glycosyltransferase involved in cell wall biosynthesis